MFDPPPGFVDLLADAELHPPPVAPRFSELEVPGVGVVHARRPMPAGVAHFAMALNNQADALVQQNHLTLFLQQHLAAGQEDRLLDDMMTRETMPADTMWRVAAAIATWGTARPYRAVGVLSVLTGKHWRVLRQRITAAGIPDPLGLPSMHTLLDWAEVMAGDSFTSGDASKDRLDRERFFDAMYKPDQVVARGKSGRAAPAGFDPASMEDAFDAAAAAH